VKGLALAALALALDGCSSSPPAAEREASTVTVFAAASLTDSFQQIADAFTAENPDVDVVVNFGGSSGLATQIAEGAPADVFAAASPAAMQASGATNARNFATNVLEIAVAAGNPGSIQGLEDFANPDKLIALCAVEVPCGAASDALFTEASITPSVDTYEQDVKAVLTKVELGEVDAGLVYVTDVIDSGVTGIAVDSTPVDYPIAALTESGRAFVDFVLSAKGQAILTAAGFGAP
jgi:molybdate transport system substrate-binding protein